MEKGVSCNVKKKNEKVLKYIEGLFEYSLYV